MDTKDLQSLALRLTALHPAALDPARAGEVAAAAAAAAVALVRELGPAVAVAWKQATAGEREARVAAVLAAGGEVAPGGGAVLRFQVADVREELPELAKPPHPNRDQRAEELAEFAGS